MKKTNKYLVIASAIAVMGIFSGCAAKSDAETTAAETTAAETTISESTAALESTTDESAAMIPESADDRELVSEGEGYGAPIVDVKKMAEDFVSLLGQTDDKVVALLGEGDYPPEEPIVTEREYRMELFGEGIITIATYEESKVSGFNIIFEGTDMGAYQKQFTEALGAPESTNKGKNDGSDVESAIWNISGANLQLTKAFDEITLQIYTPE